ncbi:MAG TPA: HNH endonuclease [Acidimicrobiales bacterium]
MSISVQTRKLLWGRSGNRCAYSECKRELVLEVTLTSRSTTVGNECHIVSRKPDGPRGDNPLPLDQRDEYDNLILLCADHHKVIDEDTVTFTVDP